MTNSTNPDAIWSLGCLFVLKNRTDDLELIDALVPPGYSPPMHRHDFGAESFYVVEGRARFVVGDEEVTLGPGGFVRVPPSTPHSFETLGDAPSRSWTSSHPPGCGTSSGSAASRRPSCTCLTRSRSPRTCRRSWPATAGPSWGRR